MLATFTVLRRLYKLFSSNDRRADSAASPDSVDDTLKVLAVHNSAIQVVRVKKLRKKRIDTRFRQELARFDARNQLVGQDNSVDVGRYDKIGVELVGNPTCDRVGSGVPGVGQRIVFI